MLFTVKRAFPRWKWPLVSLWRWVFQRWTDMGEVDWGASWRTIRWEMGYALRIRDQCDGDWYHNGWWCWPWNHGVLRFKRYLKHHNLSTALRWLEQDRLIQAALRGITPLRRPEGL